MKQIIWADGRTTEGLEIDFDDFLDYEHAAILLDCEINQVNICSEGEIHAHGITLKSDIFYRPKGLA